MDRLTIRVKDIPQLPRNNDRWELYSLHVLQFCCEWISHTHPKHLWSASVWSSLLCSALKSAEITCLQMHRRTCFYFHAEFAANDARVCAAALPSNTHRLMWWLIWSADYELFPHLHNLSFQTRLWCVRNTPNKRVTDTFSCNYHELLLLQSNLIRPIYIIIMLFRNVIRINY